LSFQEAENTSSKSNTESLNKSFEQTDQFIGERRETEEEPLQEPSQERPINSQIAQQPPLKFRLKKSKNPNYLNSFPQLAFQDHIYYFKSEIKSPVCLFYRCKNCNQHCNGYIHVSYDQKVIKQTAHSCTGNINNATIVSVLRIVVFSSFVILFFIYFKIQEHFTELKENQLIEFNFDQGQEPPLQIIQQTPLKFRFKKLKKTNYLNSFPQLAFQDNIYYFKSKIKSPECLSYRCKDHYQHCHGTIYVSYDQNVIKQTAHSCTGNIDNATIVSILRKN
jgi:hypothetical protein